MVKDSVDASRPYPTCAATLSLVCCATAHVLSQLLTKTAVLTSYCAIVSTARQSTHQRNSGGSLRNQTTAYVAQWRTEYTCIDETKQCSDNRGIVAAVTTRTAQLHETGCETGCFSGFSRSCGLMCAVKSRHCWSESHWHLLQRARLWRTRQIAATQNRAAKDL